MHVLLRADASLTQGTGHVMRCLTLSEALIASGHRVTLLTNYSEIPWLEARIAASGVAVQLTEAHALKLETVLDLAPDWAVVDSYAIPAEDISLLNEHLKVMAIVDGDSRGIDAELYLDHNLGAENLAWPGTVRSKLLAGSDYALIRDAILDVRREKPWVWPAAAPRLLAVMGGSDPFGAITVAAEAIASLDPAFIATIVAAPEWQPQVAALFEGSENVNVLPPTPDLPRLLSETDIAISAAGTSSWELCTLGVPSVLVAVVDNQEESLSTLADLGLALGVNMLDANRERSVEAITEALRRLINSVDERYKLSETCAHFFDGRGKNRVVEAMMNHTSVNSKRGSDG